MSEHTKEPWRLTTDRPLEIEGAYGDPIARIHKDDRYDEHDARRIVACVNACAGLSSETLESIEITGGLVSRFAHINALERSHGALLDAAKWACAMLTIEMTKTEYDEAGERLVAAIKKAEELNADHYG